MFKNTFLKSLILILFAALFFGIKGEASATSLAPWDIFVVTVNSNPDMVEFVSRVNMITGTKIYLSDDGRTSTGAWRNTEWYITFISSVLIPRGTIIRLTWLELASQFVFPSWAWTVTKNGTFDLATIWENILMYQWTTYNQVSPSFLYWLWFWSGTTWISTWTPTSNNSYLPSPLIFGQNALSLSSNRNIQYNCSNTALLDPSFVTAIHSASNRNSGTVAYTGSTCVFDFINPSLSINLATWQSLLTSGHLVKFFVSASEALNTGSFTCADIVLSGSFVGSSACNSIVQVSPFDRTKFEITVLATGNGVINMNILSWTVQDVAWNSNSPSTVISNTITIDQAKPVVTLISGNITLAIWSPFSDPGATWTDNSDWSWVILTATSWMVNTAVIGTYILEYTYTDTAGNTGNIVTRTVNVTDQTAPVVVLSGGNTITIAQWWTYTEEWATRTDNIDWSWIIFTSTSWTVDTNTVGTYILEYTYTDTAGNTGNIVTRTVNVTDQTPPVVTLSGTDLTLNWWDTYTEEWATRTDNIDWSWIILTPTSGTVNSNPWTYILEYTYTDTAGNTGNTVTRTVTVNNPWIPDPQDDFFTGNQDTDIDISAGRHTANDNNLSSVVSWYASIEPLHGTYTLSWYGFIYTPDPWFAWIDTLEYTLCNILNECGTATITFTIIDTQSPIVSLSWFTPITIAQWSIFTDNGANWTDNGDGSGIISSPTSGTVNTSIVWVYVLEYTYTDTAGNTGNTVTRTVNVIDQTSPIITLSWSSTITLNQWSGFIDSGASCIDDIDGILAVNISWTVNTSITGTYLMVYSCTDTAWNTSSVTRTVNVIASSIVVPVTPTTPNWSTYNPNAGNTNNNPNTNTQTNSTENSTPATGLDTSIFNTDIDTNTCFVPMDKLTVDQGNNVSALFKIAHQMLYSYGLTTIAGTKDFAPTRQITRAEAAKFFVQFAQNVLCKKTIQSYDNRFVDIAGIHPDLQANIKLSYEYGIFYGAEGGKFNPDAYISHDELVAVIIRLVTGKYDDASGTDRAANYINTLETHTSIDLTNTTRGKLAEVLYDLYKNNNYSLGDSGYVLD